MSAVALKAVELDDVAVEPDALYGIAGGLGESARSIESAFVTAGGKLATCVGLLNKVLSAFNSLSGTIASPELRSASDTLRAVGPQGREMLKAFAGERASMARLVGTLASAGGPIHDLHRTIEMIGAVAINARVVAAGMHEDADGLQVFTTDVSDLAKRAAATVGSFQDGYDGLLVKIRTVNAQSVSFERDYRATVERLGERLDHHLASLDARRGTASAASAGVEEMSRDFTKRVSQMVGALQIGDSVRQRIEHIDQALCLAAQIRGGGVPDELAGQAISAAGRDILAHGIARLQAAQLDASLQVFEGEVGAAEATLAALVTDMGRALDEALRDFHALRGGKGASIADLTAELAEAADRLRECEEERAKIDALTIEVEETVGRLLDCVADVRAVEFNMRILSMNTTISCSKLGERGKALSVVSQQLRELTATMVELSEGSATALEEARAFRPRDRRGGPRRRRGAARPSGGGQPQLAGAPRGGRPAARGGDRAARRERPQHRAARRGRALRLQRAGAHRRRSRGPVGGARGAGRWRRRDAAGRGGRSGRQAGLRRAAQALHHGGRAPASRRAGRRRRRRRTRRRRRSRTTPRKPRTSSTTSSSRPGRRPQISALTASLRARAPSSTRITRSKVSFEKCRASRDPTGMKARIGTSAKMLISARCGVRMPNQARAGTCGRLITVKNTDTVPMKFSRSSRSELRKDSEAGAEMPDAPCRAPATRPIGTDSLSPVEKGSCQSVRSTRKPI